MRQDQRLDGAEGLVCHRDHGPAFRNTVSVLGRHPIAHAESLEHVAEEIGRSPRLRQAAIDLIELLQCESAFDAALDQTGKAWERLEPNAPFRRNTERSLVTLIRLPRHSRNEDPPGKNRRVLRT